MRKLYLRFFPIVAAVASLLCCAGPVRAASTGVQDGGNFFTKEAIARADGLIADIRAIDHRDVLVVTYSGIPDDLQNEFHSRGKQAFFDGWIQRISHDNGVDGITILITRSPGHLQVDVGNKTRQRYFTVNDRDELRDKMLADLHNKQDDAALLNGLRFIRERMGRAGNSPQAQNSNAAPPVSQSNVPWNGRTNVPSTGFSVGSWLCAGLAIIGIVFFIINVVSRSRGYGGGYNAPPPGGYPPGYSGGYPPNYGGYGYGGGGGGFGRGLLGGFLGGALGGWAYDRFFQSGNSGNYNPPTSTGGNFGASSDDTDTSYSSTGGDFDSSPPDSSSSGGDFGSSSSGGDFGGGDSSGGGSDFGGGGDSGSTGGDF